MLQNKAWLCMIFPQVNHNPPLGIKLVYLRNESIMKNESIYLGNGREELIKTLPAVRQRQAEILFLGQNHWVLLPAALSGGLPPLICNSGLSITAGKERRQPGAQVVCGATTSRLITCVSSAVEPVSSCDNTQGLGFVIFLSATCTSSTSDEMKAIIWEENMLKNIENYSEVEKSISLKTQRMKFRTEL